MSSAYPGPYKSHVFNFLLRNYRQFADTCDRTLRTARFATTTSLQILLYPFYLLWQQTPLADRRLQPGEQKSLPQNGESVKIEKPKNPLSRLWKAIANFLPSPPTPSPLLRSLDETLAQLEPQIQPATRATLNRLHTAVWDGMDYLFGDKPADRQLPPPPPPLPDPWAIADSPTRQLDAPEPPPTSPKWRQLPQAEPLPTIPKTRSKMIAQLNTLDRTEIQTVPKSVNSLAAKTPASRTTAIASPPRSHSHRQVEAQPDWLETPARAIGYVKHPLQHLLEGLDRLMVALETAALKIWSWLRESGYFDKFNPKNR